MKLNIQINDHHRVAVEKCANEFGDAGTTDFLTGLREQHEKMAWRLRALLEERK